MRLCLAALCAPAATSQAQVLAEAGAPQPEEQVEVVRLQLSPAREPRPALKYRFLVPPVDQIHANAAMYVYKSMIFEAPDYIRELGEDDLSGDIDAWLQMPLAEMPRNEIRARVHWLSARSQWESLGEAARCDFCDWGDPIREHGANTVLSQAQKMRSMAIGIALKARLELAGGDYDAAHETLRTGYALTRNLDHGSCLVQCLIGMAIEGSLDEQTRAFICAPGSPNLYWALTDLADRPVDLRGALSYETKIWEFTIHELEGLEHGPLTGQQADSLAYNIWTGAGMMRAGNRKPAEPPGGIAQWATKLLPEAKAYLLDHGYAADQLEQFPPLQVVLIFRWKQYAQLRDDFFKWELLPDWQARESIKAHQEELEKQLKEHVGEPFSEALPAIRPSFYVRLKRQRQIELLRTIEALRMHAAEHGRFPDKLDDVTSVPIPRDPYTDKPFEYSGSGGVARLSTPHGETWTPHAGAVQYELELRRSAESKATDK